MNTILDVSNMSPASRLLIGGAALFCIMMVLTWFKQEPKTKAQQWRRAFASKMHKDLLRSKPDVPALIHRTRKMDALAFEELVLTAFKHAGFKVKHTTGYSGDGGIDGEVCIDGEWFLLQMKRYGAHINRQHLIDFEKVSRNRSQRGIFIHTGKTGGKSFEAIYRSNTIFLISGKSLQQLLTGSVDEAIGNVLKYAR